MKVLLIDDQVISSMGLELALKDNALTGAKFYIVHATDDIKIFLELYIFDLIIMDLKFEGLNGIYLIEKILKTTQETKVVVYTHYSEMLYGYNLREIGVRGFISKSATAKEINQEIKKVLQGMLCFSNEILLSKNINNPTLNPFSKLSKREIEILQYLLDGKKSVEICKIMKLEKSTVSTHGKNIMRKLGTTKMLEIWEMAQKYSVEYKEESS
jgi:DNA-binding NarL/FixJ family response regulator